MAPFPPGMVRLLLCLLFPGGAVRFDPLSSLILPPQDPGDGRLPVSPFGGEDCDQGLSTAAGAEGPGGLLAGRGGMVMGPEAPTQHAG